MEGWTSKRDVDNQAGSSLVMEGPARIAGRGPGDPLSLFSGVRANAEDGIRHVSGKFYFHRIQEESMLLIGESTIYRVGPILALLVIEK